VEKQKHQHLELFQIQVKEVIPPSTLLHDELKSPRTTFGVTDTPKGAKDAKPSVPGNKPGYTVTNVGNKSTRPQPTTPTTIFDDFDTPQLNTDGAST